MRRVKFEFRSSSPFKTGGSNLAFARLNTDSEEKLLRQTPPMRAVDEMVMLLHTAAEIEHNLLVQYLYSAYSLKKSDPTTKIWREKLVAIAREEMGHLIGVQNVILALGGPMNFEREDYPFNAFYPFTFKLEPFGVHSIAKYILAEMPDVKVIPPELGFDLNAVIADAQAEPSPVNRVGLLYQALGELINEVSESDFNKDSVAFQSNPEEWAAGVFNLMIQVVQNRQEGKDLLLNIAEQGEGLTIPADASESHFIRFFNIYKELKAPGSNPSLQNVVTNPTTKDETEAGYIKNSTARLWSMLFNIRYRMLLCQLNHLMLLRNDRQPERKYRSRLKSWCLEEMRLYLSETSNIITTLPLDDSGTTTTSPILAGPPFELPFSLMIPGREADRWRNHKLLIDSSFDVMKELSGRGNDAFLKSIATWDTERIVYINERIVEFSTT